MYKRQVLAKVKGFDTFVSDMSAIKDKYKELLDNLREVAEEKRHNQRVNVRTIDVGIGHDDYFLVTQLVYIEMCIRDSYCTFVGLNRP